MTASTASTPHRPPPLPRLDGGDVLTTADAADLLACSPRTVTGLITRGHLRAFRLGEGRTAWRIRAADLLAFVEQHGTHEPATVAASDPGTLPGFTPSPALLLETRTPDGLRLVTPHRPPDTERDG